MMKKISISARIGQTSDCVLGYAIKDGTRSMQITGINSRATVEGHKMTTVESIFYPYQIDAWVDADGVE